MLEQLGENEKLIKESFFVLKTVCDELVKSSTKENCIKFSDVIENTDKAAFPYLLEYVLFPVQYHLYRHISKNSKLQSPVLLELLKILKIILSKTSIKDVAKFVELSILLLQILTENENLEMIQDVNEDIKYAVIACVVTLYENLDYVLLFEIYNPKKRNNCHAQAVYICTQIARNEKSLKLRIIALKCLLAIVRVSGETYRAAPDKLLRHDIAETIAPILPGIISMCYFIITSGSMLHHSLFIYSVRVFSRLVTLIFENDKMEMKDHSWGFSVTGSQSVNCDTTKNDENTLRTTEWYQNTAAKLVTYTKGLVPICNNVQWKVRLELVKAADLILSHCSDKVNSFSTTLVEILIILSKDTMKEISDPAQNSVRNLLNENTKRSKQVLEFLEENMYSVMDSIELSLNSIDENILLSQLNLLHGYLNILNLQKVFKSSAHLQNLISSLIKTVRFDATSLDSFHKLKIQDLQETNSTDILSHTITWKNSKYLSCNSENAVKRICQTIAEKVDTHSLTYYLLDLFESHPNDRKEVLFLINNITLCETQHYGADHYDLLKTVLKTYLDSSYWSVPVSTHGDDFFDSTPLSLVHSNILQVCLLTEGIGKMSVCLQRNFSPLLLLCLYSIIENAGSTNEYISSSGLTALKKITVSCGYNDISDIVTQNVDYITYHISLKLRNLRQHAQVFNVLEVIILHCEQKSLPVLCDVVETMLRNHDILQDLYRDGFLRVFRIFVRKLRKWHAPLLNDEVNALNESEEKHLQFLATVDRHVSERKGDEAYRFLQDTKDEDINLEDMFRHDGIDFDSMDFEDTEEPDKIEKPSDHEPQSQYIEDNEVKEEIPHHIQLIISIAKRTTHILSTKDAMSKIMILEILMDTLLILCDKENQLLPVVHKIWAPLVNRFKYDQEDPLIIRRSFELLCVMAVTARDFIKNRTLKEVSLILNNTLLRTAKESKLKDKKSVYRMSQKYKLQRTLLNELGHLGIYISLQEKELNDVLVAATPYLSSKQPKPLQVACTSLFSFIASSYYELVWVHLMSLYPPEIQLVPLDTEMFRVIRLVKPEENKELENNVTNILKVIS